ncbi:hypothetical protein Hanom_Chr01g00076441 [Helianthus anomalus]
MHRLKSHLHLQFLCSPTRTEKLTLQVINLTHLNRPVNVPNVHELFVNLFGGKFVYVRLFNKERT